MPKKIPASAPAATLNGSAAPQDKPQLIPLDLTDPHPDNPRIILRDDVVEAIAADLRERGGFDPCHAILVRPMPSGRYQVISGHQRREGSFRAGIDSVFAWVREMDDDQAYIELVRCNNQGELKPIEVGIHALKYCGEVGGGGRGKTGGLSEYARKIGRNPGAISQLAAAARVFAAVSASEDIDPARIYDRPVGIHLYHVSKAPAEDWGWLTLAVLEENWSVDATRAAVDAVLQICEIPNWLQPIIPPRDWKKKAIGDQRVISDLYLWVNTAIARHGELSPHREVKVGEGEEFRVEYWNLQERFAEELGRMKNPSATRINSAAQRVLDAARAADEAFQQWEASRRSEADRLLIEENMQRQLLQMREEYAPIGVCGDAVVEMLNLIDAGAEFGLILTDPPYLLSNGGSTCRSGREASVDKNFDDSSEEAIGPGDWVPPCSTLLKAGGLLIFTCTDHIRQAATAAAVDSGLELLETLIWYKHSVPPRLTPTGHKASHENILVFRKPGAAHRFNYDYLCDKYWGGAQPGSVLEFEQCGGKERLGWHDTQKPLSLWRYLVEAYSAQGDRLLDPFAGSGTTPVAAKLTGRKCHWVELKPDFYDRASSRVEHTRFHWEADPA